MEIISTLTELGYSRRDAARALHHADGDEDKAYQVSTCLSVCLSAGLMFSLDREAAVKGAEVRPLRAGQISIRPSVRVKLTASLGISGFSFSAAFDFTSWSSSARRGDTGGQS